MTFREFVADAPEQTLELAQRFIAENLGGVNLDFYEACDSPIKSSMPTRKTVAS